MQVNYLTKMRIKRRKFARKLQQDFGSTNRIINLAWGLVVLGGIVECFWVSGLKHADSTLLYALTALGIIFSFSAMILACKVLEVSIAYSVFVGIGTAGVVAGEIFIFGEPFSAIKVSLIALLLFAVIALKFVSQKEDGKAQDEALVENLSSDLGIDNALDSALQAKRELQKGGLKCAGDFRKKDSRVENPHNEVSHNKNSCDESSHDENSCKKDSHKEDFKKEGRK